MEYLIIGFVVLSIMGSVMWVMPTKRDRMLAALRMQAKQQGFQVQLTRLTYPREHGEVEPRVVSSVAYRLLRGKIGAQQHTDWKSWRIVRCESNSSEGLCAGWGWGLGERTMTTVQLDKINSILQAMPNDVVGVESTPIHVSVFWAEKNEQELDSIKLALKDMITKTI
ncbi:hypothetical protein WN093_02795 [Gammaproteobacteria bacterium AS21]